MTVIVYTADDGVMAADTGSYRGSFIVATNATKIIRTPAGVLVGCAGLASRGDAFRLWATNGFPADQRPEAAKEENDFAAIVVFPDGTLHEYDHELNCLDITSEGWAFEGLGQEFAMALRTLGWGAERIVAHMIQHCVWANGAVYSLRLEAQSAEVTQDEPEPAEVTDLEIPVGQMMDPNIRSFMRDRGLE